MTDMLKYGFSMVEEESATGELAEIYDAIKRDLQMPAVPNMMKANAISVPGLKLYFDIVKSFYTHLTLPMSLMSLILFTIAHKSDCTYCTAAHEVTCRTLGVDEATLRAVAQDLGELNPERIRVIIEFALKAAKHPQDLVPDDYENLRAMGISNDEIVQIIHVAGIAVYVDLIADALKVEVDQALIDALGQ